MFLQKKINYLNICKQVNHLSNFTSINNYHNSLIKFKNSIDNKMNTTVGFIGSGQMATALAKGLINSGLLTSNDILQVIKKIIILVNLLQKQE